MRRQNINIQTKHKGAGRKALLESLTLEQAFLEDRHARLSRRKRAGQIRVFLPLVSFPRPHPMDDWLLKATVVTPKHGMAAPPPLLVPLTGPGLASPGVSHPLARYLSFPKPVQTLASLFLVHQLLLFSVGCDLAFALWLHGLRPQLMIHSCLSPYPHMLHGETEWKVGPCVCEKPNNSIAYIWENQHLFQFLLIFFKNIK